MNGKMHCRQKMCFKTQRLHYTADDAATVRRMRRSTVRTTQYEVQLSNRTVALTNLLQHTIAFAVRMDLS